MKSLRKLFSYTQSKQAKAIACIVLIPIPLMMARQHMWHLAYITYELVQTMTYWQSLPYVSACAVVFAVTGCFKNALRNARVEPKGF